MHLKYDKEAQAWLVNRVTEEEKKVLILYGIDMVLAAVGTLMVKDKEQVVKKIAKESKKATKQ